MERLLLLSLNPNPQSPTQNQSEIQTQLVLEYMHNLVMAILHSLCFYSTSSASGTTVQHQRLKINGKTNTFMRPITAVLLPAILEHGQRQVDIGNTDDVDVKVDSVSNHASRMEIGRAHV